MKLYVVYELLVFEDHQVKREERFFKNQLTARKICKGLNDVNGDKTYVYNMVVVEDL